MPVRISFGLVTEKKNIMQKHEFCHEKTCLKVNGSYGQDKPSPMIFMNPKNVNGENFDWAATQVMCLGVWSVRIFSRSDIKFDIKHQTSQSPNYVIRKNALISVSYHSLYAYISSDNLSGNDIS